MSQLLQIATRSGLLPAVDGVAAPAYVSQGIPFDATGVAVDTAGAVSYYHQGLPFTANGRLVIAEIVPSYYGSGAAPFTATGILSGDGSGIDHVNSGIPYGITGGIAVDGLVPFLGVLITSQPSSQTVVEGASVSFVVSAISGNLSPLFYQWQEFLASVWTPMVNAPPVSGVSTATLTINPTTLVMTGRQFRCVVNNDNDSKTTNVVTLTVNSAVSFFLLTEAGDKIVLEDSSGFVLSEAA